MIACIAVSYFAAAVEQRDNQSLLEMPLVVGGQPWEPRPVYAFSQDVAQRGVRPGMSLRLAHALSPQSHFMPATPPKYYATSGEIIDILVDFTHLVESENLWQIANAKPQHSLSVVSRSLPGRYYVDLESLPQREATPLACEMGRTVRSETQLGPSIGLAKDKFTASVAAALTSPSHTRPIASGDERNFLAKRSINFLPLNKEITRRLRLLGIRTLGQLTALPLHALHEQFGSEIVPLYRMARGDTISSVQPLQPERQEQVVHHFEAPIVDMLVLQAVLRQTTGELIDRMQKAGVAGQKLHLTLSFEEGTIPLSQALVLRSSVCDFVHLYSSLCEILNQIPITSGVTTMTVTISGLSPAIARQLSLFSSQTPSLSSKPLSSKKPLSANAIEQTLRSVMTRYKSAGFYQPVSIDRHHPLPECRFQLRTLLGANLPTAA